MHDHDLPSAGWHPDPTNDGQLRYWNGQSWTDHVHPLQPSSPDTSAKQHRSTGQPAPGLIRTIFDFKLRADRVATVRIARFVYVTVSLAALLLWFGLVVVAFLAAASTGMPEFAVIGIIVFVAGAIVVVTFIAAVRVLLEFVLANIRTAQHTAYLVDHARHGSESLGFDSYGADLDADIDAVYRSTS